VAHRQTKPQGSGFWFHQRSGPIVLVRASRYALTVRPAKIVDGAYAEMEPHLCDVVRMGEIASMLFDDPDQGRFVFAVTHLDDMLREFRARYYAMDFPA